MPKLVVPEFQQNVAFQDSVIKNEVDKAMLISDQDALLTRFETEPVTEFKKEVLQLVEQRVLETAFGHDVTGVQPEELEDVGSRMKS